MKPRALILLLGTCLAGPAMAEGVLAQLYAPRPAEGSAFVRVVNPTPDTLKVKIGTGTEQAIGPAKLASSYAIVKGDEPFTVSINGKSAGQMTVKKNSFNTLVQQGGKFEVAGQLTIKGTAREVVVPVALTQSGAVTTATGTLPLKRLAFKIGENEWADTSMVADDVQVKFKLALSGVGKL